MADNECRTIDTRAFDAVMDTKDEVLKEYERINREHDRIVKELLGKWNGRGAKEFEADCQKVRSNIEGIQEILKTMCDTLTDCRKVIAEADKSIGESNAKPLAK